MRAACFWRGHWGHQILKQEWHHQGNFQHCFHCLISDDMQGWSEEFGGTAPLSGVHNMSGQCSWCWLDSPRCNSLLFLGTMRKVKKCVEYLYFFPSMSQLNNIVNREEILDYPPQVLCHLWITNILIEISRNLIQIILKFSKLPSYILIYLYMAVHYNHSFIHWNIFTAVLQPNTKTKKFHGIQGGYRNYFFESAKKSLPKLS